MIQETLQQQKQSEVQQNTLQDLKEGGPKKVACQEHMQQFAKAHVPGAPGDHGENMNAIYKEYDDCMKAAGLR